MYIPIIVLGVILVGGIIAMIYFRAKMKRDEATKWKERDLS